MNPKLPTDRPLYQRLLALNAPEDYLELMMSLVRTPRQEEELLKWMEISGETDLQTIMESLYEIIDPDRQLPSLLSQPHAAVF